MSNPRPRARSALGASRLRGRFGPRLSPRHIKTLISMQTLVLDINPGHDLAQVFFCPVSRDDMNFFFAGGICTHAGPRLGLRIASKSNQDLQQDVTSLSLPHACRKQSEARKNIVESTTWHICFCVVSVSRSGKRCTGTAPWLPSRRPVVTTPIGSQVSRTFEPQTMETRL